MKGETAIDTVLRWEQERHQSQRQRVLARIESAQLRLSEIARDLEAGRNPSGIGSYANDIDKGLAELEMQADILSRMRTAVEFTKESYATPTKALRGLLESINEEQELGHLADYTEGFNKAVAAAKAALPKPAEKGVARG